MDFDVWAQKGNRGWSYNDVLPYFRRYESHDESADASYRGQTGEMRITDLAWRDPLCEAFIKGAESIGIPRNSDYNGAIQEGTSFVQRTSTGKLRMSAARAFPEPGQKARQSSYQDQRPCHPCLARWQTGGWRCLSSRQRIR